MCEEKLGIKKACSYFAAISKPLVVGVPVEVVDIAQVDPGLSVNGILTRQKSDPLQQ